MRRAVLFRLIGFLVAAIGWLMAVGRAVVDWTGRTTFVEDAEALGVKLKPLVEYFAGEPGLLIYGVAAVLVALGVAVLLQRPLLGWLRAEGALSGSSLSPKDTIAGPPGGSGGQSALVKLPGGGYAMAGSGGGGGGGGPGGKGGGDDAGGSIHIGPTVVGHGNVVGSHNITAQTVNVAVAQSPAPNPLAERHAILVRLRHLYIISHDGISSSLLAGWAWPPEQWINDELRKLALPWRVHVQDNDDRVEVYESNG